MTLQLDEIEMTEVAYPAAPGMNGTARTPPDSEFTRPNLGVFVSCVIVLGTNVLLLSGDRIAFVGAALGWWLIILHPAYQICTTRLWKTVTGAERVAYSVGGVLLALILGGLLIDVVLPHFGVPRPLAQRPVLIAVDVMNVALMALRLKLGAEGSRWYSKLRSLQRREWRVLTVSALCVPLVVAGANRLNNGHGDLVTLVGLSSVAAAFVLLLFWRADLRDSVLAASTYLLGLSLLLATSLRGWSITGHDIQEEFRVFELTKDNGVWNVSQFRNAYNACLSITILPTEIWQMVRVDDPYVFKVFLQLLFAVCPVLVYLLARRFWSKGVAILSVVYFVGFPTFFTDMPFLNRQEIAFVFLGLAFLVATRKQWTAWRRRVVLSACALGIGLSHYSTMYVFIGTLAIAWAAAYGYLLVGRVTRRFTGRHRQVPKWADMARAVTLGVILASGLISFVWGAVITRTDAQLVTTVESAWPPVGGIHSGDVSYSLFSSGSRGNPQQLLDQYEKQSLHVRKDYEPGTYLPLSKALAFPAVAVNAQSLPLTRVGKLLSDLHVPVASVNSAVRVLATKGEQVFVGLGLLTLGFVGWRRRHVGRDFYFLAVGSVVMVAAVTVLPGLSVSYGVLRAFQQALFLIAPVLVIGSFAIFKPLGRVWAVRVATAVALIFFISTTGVMPQILGGYPAQLNLNNSGVYYEDYYVHPQEVEAISWLSGQPGTLPTGVQAENFSNLYYLNDPKAITSQYVTDIYPTLLQKSTWVVLGYSTVHTGIATAPINGDLITYRYPMGVLKQNKDLVYDNGGTEIYK